MKNLLAEMARYGVTKENIRETLGCSAKTVDNKLGGKTEFSVNEAILIRDTYFPGMRIKYLFGNEQAVA